MVTKPDTLGVRLDAIPEPLKVLDRWIVWDLERRDKKWTKIPKQANGKWASTSDSSTWSSFEDACEAVPNHTGLGLILPSGIVGLDLDDCYSSDGFDEQAKMMLAMMPTYAEYSPSGSGVKLLAAGALNDDLKKISHGKGVELYDGASTNRFFTITGHCIDAQKHATITNQRGSLAAIQAMISEPKKDRVNDELDPQKATKAREYLAHLADHRCEEYTDWLSVGMALHWCDPSEEMFEAWDKWSSESSKYDQEACRRKWESFDADRGERVLTLNFLRTAAKEDGYDPDRFQTGMMTGLALLKKRITREYLVEDMVVKGEPMIVGGASKSLKTTVSLDLALSMATATPFLGKFRVPERKRLLFISGESGEATLQENLQAMAESRGVRPEELDDFHISFKLPKLDDPTIVDNLLEELRDKQIDVLFVDPLYRSLRVGDGASNVYAMGEQLELIAERIHRAGITVILCHHFRKQGRSYDEAPELEDLSQAGVAEFGRQFLLLKRRSGYEMDGKHTLWFHWGGSAGHQGLKMLDAYTGTRQTGTTWQTTLRSIEEWKELQKAEKELQSAEERQTKKEQIVEFLAENGPTSMTKIREAVKGNNNMFKDLLAELDDEGRAVQVSRKWSLPDAIA